MRIDRSSGRWLIPKVALLFLALTASFASAQGGPVQYGYDELGRLVVVVDGAGNTAIYNYDSVGNLLSIQRVNSADITDPVAIFAVVPTQGRVGSPVSIFGKGFSATPAQNTVSFNGGPATVTSASPTRLRVTVPATAVDGPITVTAPAGSATSPMPFRVTGPLTVTPAGASIGAGTALQFSATGPGGSAPPVFWAVNAIPGGNAGVGTISAGGLYSGPVYLNQPIVSTITATDQNDATANGSVTVSVIPRRLAVAQGVSVSVGQQTVSNSLQTSVSAVIGGNQINKNLQTSVSAVIGGTAITRNLQTSVSAVIGGTAITRNLQASVSAVIGGDPMATAATAVSVSFGPVITSVSPAAGALGAVGLAVTLTGAGFNDATQVTFLRNNVPDTTISTTLVSVSPDGTQATLQLSIASGALTGARVVEITTPSGASTVVGTGANIFTVQ